MSLTVIIVNYKSGSLISDCIDSAMQFPSYKHFEWIVVDNGSGDGSDTLISSRFPFVRWIPMDYNAGFARANNEGIRRSSGDVILLLNPDTLIIDDAIMKCYERFTASSYVACGVQLINLDGTPQITGSYFMKGGLNHLLPLPYLGTLLKKIAFGLSVKKTNVLAASREEKVDWINGAFLMVKKSAISEVGMLDEDFFLYSEEIEWCSRLRKIGQLCVYGDLKTIHLLGQTINTETKTTDQTYFNLFDKKGLQLMVSNHVRIRKQFGPGWFMFHLIMHTLEVPVFLVCRLLDNMIHLNNPLKGMSEVKGYIINVFNLWRLSGRILANKPYFYKMI